MQGQAMIEYVVILAALSAALIASGNGSIGLSKTDNGSLLEAMHERYTEQAYALSISEAPETDDLAELAEYYNSLNKYPALSSKLEVAAVTLAKVTNGLAVVDKGLTTLKKYTDPAEAIKLIDTDTIKNEVKNQLEDAINPF
jgi:Flp pilus assembly pilin Flp